MASNENLNAGDWVMPKWQGHAYAGQTGQVLGISPNGNNFLIDVDGDGSTDYYLSTTGNHNSGSFTHTGMMSSSFESVVESSIPVFNTIVLVVISVVALKIFIPFLKRARA